MRVDFSARAKRPDRASLTDCDVGKALATVNTVAARGMVKVFISVPTMDADIARKFAPPWTMRCPMAARPIDPTNAAARSSTWSSPGRLPPTSLFFARRRAAQTGAAQLARRGAATGRVNSR